MQEGSIGQESYDARVLQLRGNQQDAIMARGEAGGDPLSGSDSKENPRLALPIGTGEVVASVSPISAAASPFSSRWGCHEPPKQPLAFDRPTRSSGAQIPDFSERCRVRRYFFEPIRAGP